MKKLFLAITLAALAAWTDSHAQDVFTHYGPQPGLQWSTGLDYHNTAATPVQVSSVFCSSSSTLYLRADGTCAAPPGSGVSSITVPAPLTASGGCAGGGACAITWTGAQTANQVLATPNGTTGPVGLRALVGADIAPINLGSTANGGVLSTSILPSTNGGTSNGFFSVTGPATATRTFTFPNASATVLTTNAAVTVAQGGTGLATLTANSVLLGEGTSNLNQLVLGADTVLRGTAAADPVAAAVPNCGSSTTALNYNTSTHAFGCQTISVGGTGTVTSLTGGTGVTATPSTITSTGSFAVDQTFAPTWTALHTYSLAWSSGNPGTVLYSSATPFSDWNVTGGGTDQKRWVVYGTGSGATTFNVDSWNDASTLGDHALSITRGTGVAIGAVAIGNATDNPAVTINGSTAAVVNSGTFTATLTGMSAATTGTMNYTRVGNVCFLTVPTPISGTSNATTFTVTGLPAICTPAISHGVMFGDTVNDAGAAGAVGVAEVGSTGTIVMGKLAGSPPVINNSGWTASGSKGLNSDFAISYSTN